MKEKRYPHSAGKALMTAGMLICAAVTIISSIFFTYAVLDNYYGCYRSEILDYMENELTVQKTYAVLNDYIRVQNGFPERSASSDYKGRTNFRYDIYDTLGEKCFGNYDGQKYTSTFTGEHKYYIMDMDRSLSAVGYCLAERVNKSPFEAYNLNDAVFGTAYDLRYALPVIVLVSLAAVIVLFCCLMRSAGHHNGDNEVTYSWLEKIPFDIVTALLVSTAFGVIYLLAEITTGERLSAVAGSCLTDSFGIFLMMGILYVTFYILSHTLAVRIKTVGVIRKTAVYRVIAFAVKWVVIICKLIYSSVAGLLRGTGSLIMLIPSVWRSALCCAGVMAYTFIIMILMQIYHGSTAGVLLILWLVFMAAVFAFVVYLAWSANSITASMRDMAGGNISRKTDVSRLFYSYRRQGEYLNSLSGGLEEAVNARLRSERFKTELITNVSHDIKTPLTSIINYSGLLLAEKPEGKSGEYAEVIYRQSERLKKLTEDLLEASKASSGTVEVNFERIGLCQMLRQSVGEYDERLTSAGLTPILRLPNESDEVYINADGRLLWRVFDNLLSNIVKYSLSGTRVYITLAASDGKAQISFRNISSDIIEADAGELTERFVRGDLSRHSEGSGLGLSIALSLCELMRGKMSLSCDGDIFKVSLTFGIC